MTQIKVEYYRQGFVYYGRILIDGEVHKALVGYSFEEILREAAELMNKHPTAQLMFSRTTSGVAHEFVFDEVTAQRLHTDTESVVKELCPESITVNFRDSEETDPDPLESTIPSPPNFLRVGTETRTQAFGEEIFLRGRRTDSEYARVECPLCGRFTASASYVGGALTILCICGNHLPVQHCFDNCDTYFVYLSVKVEELLSKPSTRFYIPQPWNTEGPWISKDQLSAMLKDYLEKKASLNSLVN